MGAHGNTNREVRKFLRQIGVKPNASNVERIGKEVRRTESQHENNQRLHGQAAKELGHSGTVTPTGRDAHKVVRKIMRRKIDERE